MAKRARPPPIIQRLQVTLTLVGFDSAREIADSARGCRTDFIQDPKHCRQVHGSRMDWPIPRANPLSRYAATERVPMFMSAVKVMPGINRKFSGTL